MNKGEKPFSQLGSVPSAGTKEANGVNRLGLPCTGEDPSCYLLFQFLTNSSWRSLGLNVTKSVGPHGEGRGAPSPGICFLSVINRLEAGIEAEIMERCCFLVACFPPRLLSYLS